MDLELAEILYAYAAYINIADSEGKTAKHIFENLEIYGNGYEYFIYGRFKNANAFKQELEDTFDKINKIFIQKFTIIDASVFETIDDGTKCLLLKIRFTNYSLKKSKL